LLFERGNKLFAIGTTELRVVVALFTAELRADGTVSVAKSETELRADGTVSVAKLETELKAFTVAFGIVFVAKFVIEFRVELLFFALLRLDTPFIAELSKYS
jgi:hypothetical protein